MKKLVLLLVCAAGLQQSFAQSYAVDLINDSLKKDANVVVRWDEERYELKSLEKAIVYHKYAVTILNEKGDAYASFGVGYDQLRTIDYIEGSLFDAQGKKIKSLKKSELRDLSGTGEESLASDARYKAHNFYYRAYPYTVEYEYQMINRETLFTPVWYAQNDEECSVENSKFTLLLPANYPLRYKAFNYPGEPQTTQQGDKISYLWSVKNLTAQKELYGFPGWKYVSPSVRIGPGEFQMDKYKGKSTTWEDLGRFIMDLNSGRDALPDNIRQQVHALVDGKQDTKQKVEALYDFLQKNTHYISIQFGVGGLQPFDAAYVAKNRYGDCKALSNYMYSLLKEAGINSCYAVIKSGDDAEDIVSDFPSSQFDHVILCVPMQKDTMWLECTSQTKAPGYMGMFTGNRHALLITSEGGKLVRTPSYGLNDNWQNVKVKAVIDETGNAMVEQAANYSGISQEYYSGMINYLSKDKLKEFLNRIMGLATYDIVDFNYTEDRKSVPVVHERLKLSVSNYGQITGKRLFVAPNITNRWSTKLQPETRKYPIRLINAYVESDSVEITIPSGYTPEAVPDNIVAESKFGKYQASYKVEGNKITYYRRYERYNGFFDKSLYDELVKFYEKIYKADRNRIVLVKS